MNNIDMKSFIIGLLSSICLLLLFGHSNTIPDEVKCRSLVVLNKDGKEIVWIGASESDGGYIETTNDNQEISTKITGGSIRNYNKFGIATTYLGQSSSGNGMITINNKYDAQTVYIGSNTSNAGLVTVNGKTGNRSASMYSNDGSGTIDLLNNLGKDIVYLGVSEENDGMMSLRDSNGNLGISCNNGALRTYDGDLQTAYIGTSTIGAGLVILSGEDREGGLVLNPYELNIFHDNEESALRLGAGFMFMNDNVGNNYGYLGYNKNTYNGMFAIYDNKGELIFGK